MSEFWSCLLLATNINSILSSLVFFRGQKKLEPHPNWSLLGVLFKISEEHPCPFHIGVPPPPPLPRAVNISHKTKGYFIYLLNPLRTSISSRDFKVGYSSDRVRILLIYSSRQ